MHLVGKVTLSCEAAITVATWRVMMKLLCRCKPHLPGDWSIQPIVFDLCEAAKTKLEMCLRIGVQLQVSNNGTNQVCMCGCVCVCVCVLCVCVCVCNFVGGT